MQLRITDLALPDILAAAQQHSDEAELVGKALVALGVLGQVGSALWPLGNAVRWACWARWECALPCTLDNAVSCTLGVLGQMGSVLWALSG